MESHPSGKHILRPPVRELLWRKSLRGEHPPSSGGLVLFISNTTRKCPMEGAGRDPIYLSQFLKLWVA